MPTNLEPIASPLTNINQPGTNNGGVTPPPAPPPTSAADYYLQLIQSDPGYLQIKAALEASRVSAAAQRASDVQRALIDFGIVPEGFLSEDVSDLTRNLAQQSTSSGLSVAARLQKAHQDSVRNIQNNLAARGILQSGETGFQLGEQQLASAQAQHDATKQLLDYLAGVQAAFAQGEAERGQTAAEAAAEAMQRQMDLALATGADLPQFPGLPVQNGQPAPAPTTPAPTPVPPAGNTTPLPQPPVTGGTPNNNLAGTTSLYQNIDDLLRRGLR